MSGEAIRAINLQICGIRLILWYTHAMRKARLFGARLWSAATWIVIVGLTVFFSTLIAAARVLCWWIDPKRTIPHGLASLWGQSIFWSQPGWRVQVIGRQHLKANHTYIFVANHQSAFDIMALYFLRRQFKWIAKEELFRLPFAGWSMRLAGYISLGRGRVRSIHATYERARAWLAEDISVFFFPEGTRSTTGKLGAFQRGAFQVAVDTGVSVVPIAVQGTRELLPRHSLVLRRRGRIRIVVHPPIDPVARQMTAVDLRDEARRLIAGTLEPS
ncbi:MAG TPA: 1-acyl-sn-glycerol-3-phosphate acyltransferase [Candidatus Omnitrophica bacterium]|nr:1-acyl-sn-glycerol-3-phosphate acyltransferase [Candidatus Omnitrophota bacterium]HBQ37786.1 1-acyl-sn-glycerol-3-phosphate acyltransferase [Candidatus Omnitrophota bacterium]